MEQLASSSFDSTESSNALFDGSFPMTVAPPSTTRWREHSDVFSADSPPNGTNSGDPHESRPISASGSLEGNLPEVIVPITSSKSSRKSSSDDQTTTVSTMSITNDQLFLVQCHFPDAVVQKVQAPDLVVMSRRQRQRALLEYRNQLKEYQLVFMGFDEQAVRQALKDTYRKDTRTEQHVQDAAHKLNMEQLASSSFDSTESSNALYDGSF